MSLPALPSPAIIINPKTLSAQETARLFQRSIDKISDGGMIAIQSLLKTLTHPQDPRDRMS